MLPPAPQGSGRYVAAPYDWRCWPASGTSRTRRPRTRVNDLLLPWVAGPSTGIGTAAPDSAGAGAGLDRPVARRRRWQRRRPRRR